ncbi:Ribonuclease/ribotoxin, partial [Flammula alnicola]
YQASSGRRNHPCAPLTDGGTRSGYPHQFTNVGGIVWPNKRCNHLAPGHILLEFPVFEDGHLYCAECKPKPDPGPARAIFTSPRKDFCGVVAHTHGNEGPLVLCTK